MHPALLFPGYLGLALAPLALAFLQGRPVRSFWDELAAGLGLVAFAVLLLEFLLSGRFRWVSGGVGIDVTMRFHQGLARSAAVFVVIHPVLYRTPILGQPLPWDTTAQAGLGLSGATLVTGLLAWVFFLLLVLAGIFRDQLPYKYETWRWAHGLGAVLVAGLTAHHALFAGRYSGDMVLGAFWLCLLAVAIGTLVYVYVVEPLRQLRAPYAVRSVRRIAERTWELVVEPKGKYRLDFAAGQFVWLNVGNSTFSVHENPFSISSAPAEAARIEFVIKELGDFTRSLGAIAPGTKVHLDGPHGNLTLAGTESKGIAFIAGGVGIAPVLSILRQLCHEGERRPLILVYGNRMREQIVYEQEFEDMAARMSLHVEHVLSEPPPNWTGKVGGIDKEVIDSVFAFEEAPEWLYVICGPPPMIEAVEDALLARGVPARQLLSERFRYD